MYARIVIPLDGSELAEKALPHAEGLSRLVDAPLHLVRVVDPHGPVRYPGAIGAGVEELADGGQSDDETAHSYLDQMERTLIARGCAVSTEVRNGPISSEICAATEPGDVVVMASHGRGGLARWFVGSVAEEVVRQSNVPVLLVRAGTVTPAGGTALAQHAPAE